MDITVVAITLILCITVIIKSVIDFKREELCDQVWGKQLEIDELNMEILRLKREIQTFNEETTISPEAKERYNREWGLKPGDWGYLE